MVREIDIKVLDCLRFLKVRRPSRRHVQLLCLAPRRRRRHALLPRTTEEKTLVTIRADERKLCLIEDFWEMNQQSNQMVCGHLQRHYRDIPRPCGLRRTQSERPDWIFVLID